MNNFAELGLSKQILSALEEFGYIEPTKIQMQALPEVLAGKDIMASAQTGSGKTAAFALPIIEKMLETPLQKKPRVLVLVPTRELCLQVAEQFVRFGKNAKLRTSTIYGGTGYFRQEKELKRGVDVIVATPGRLYDHMKRKTCDISMVDTLVLDEADRLLDMGFMPQVRKIVEKLSRERQTLMFSATIDRRVEQLAREFLRSPVTIRVNDQQVEPKDIEQKMYNVHEFGKDALLLQLIKDTEEMKSLLIFTRTRRKAAWVKDRLRDAKVMAEEIHGDISQAQRERTLSRYRDGDFAVLVATDVAARGLDIPSISHVINYDLPNTAADYVHRIGRTGRAGRAGCAFSFVSEEQRHLIRDIEKIVGKDLDPNPRSHSKAKPGGGRRLKFNSPRKRWA